MSIKLRELIRAVRGCKTAAEERKVIKDESAQIRTMFKEKGTETTPDDVAITPAALVLALAPTHPDCLGYFITIQWTLACVTGASPNCCTSTCSATPPISARWNA
jgi:hypothetical protein